eukprot:6175529-Pleurochrysis_carterae.AAC.1
MALRFIATNLHVQRFDVFQRQPTLKAAFERQGGAHGCTHSGSFPSSTEARTPPVAAAADSS